MRIFRSNPASFQGAGQEGVRGETRFAPLLAALDVGEFMPAKMLIYCVSSGRSMLRPYITMILLVGVKLGSPSSLLASGIMNGGDSDDPSPGAWLRHAQLRMTA